MSSIQGHLTQSIHRVLGNWLAGESAINARQIVEGNAPWGLPRDFIADVYGEMGRSMNPYANGLSELKFTDLLNEVGTGDYEFDRLSLKLLHGHADVPEGVSLEDMDDQAETMLYAFREYEWIVFERRHYDAEAPEGRDSVFELPFFERYLENMKREKALAVQSLPDHLMIWPASDLDETEAPF